MTQIAPPAPGNRSPEEIAAGNRRALFGCGGMLLVGLLLTVLGFRACRSVMGGQKTQGQACDKSSECRHDHVCASNLFSHATRTVCRKTCDENADCPSRRCEPILESQRALGGFHGVCR